MEKSQKKLIPKEYKEVCIDNLIFVLDGFDEIAIEYRRMFVINLEAFCNNYKNVKIILISTFIIVIFNYQDLCL